MQCLHNNKLGMETWPQTSSYSLAGVSHVPLALAERTGSSALYKIIGSVSPAYTGTRPTPTHPDIWNGDKISQNPSLMVQDEDQIIH